MWYVSPLWCCLSFSPHSFLAPTTQHPRCLCGSRPSGKTPPNSALLVPLLEAAEEQQTVTWHHLIMVIIISSSSVRRKRMWMTRFCHLKKAKANSLRAEGRRGFSGQWLECFHSTLNLSLGDWLNYSFLAVCHRRAFSSSGDRIASLKGSGSENANFRWASSSGKGALLQSQLWVWDWDPRLYEKIEETEGV